MKETKLIGYILKAELNWWIKTPIDKADGNPIFFEVWKDGKDLRYCEKGSHIKKVEITIKEYASNNL